MSLGVLHYGFCLRSNGFCIALKKIDINNLYGNDNKVFISIYDKDLDKFYNYDIEVNEKNRKQNKELVVNFIIEKLLYILNDIKD